MLKRIGICDDEEDYRLLIEKEIKNYYMDREDYEIYLYDHATKILEDFSNLNIIFLDIEMPNMNGLELKKRLEVIDYKGSIIFVTNYEQYMNEAFGKNVVAYVSKDNLHRISAILKDIDKLQGEDNIIRIADTFIKTSDICYITADKGYSKINTKKKEYYYSIYLNDILKRLNNDQFMQIHRSFIVNFRYIETFGATHVKLIDGTTINLSRKYKDDFKTKYFRYIREE